MKKYTQLSIATLLASQLSWAGNVDITRPMIVREKMYSLNFDLMENLSDLRKREALKTWVATAMRAKSGKYYWAKDGLQQAFFHARKKIKNKQLLQLLAYYVYRAEKENIASVYDFYFTSMVTLINEVATDPILLPGNPTKNLAQKFFKDYPGVYDAIDKMRADILKAAEGLKPMHELGDSDRRQAGNAAIDFYQHVDKRVLNSGIFNLMTETALEVLGQGRYGTIFTPEKLASSGKALTPYRRPPFVLSYTGYVKGNKIDHLTENNRSPEYIGDMGILESEYRSSPWFNMSIEDFKSKMDANDKTSALTKVFKKFPRVIFGEVPEEFSAHPSYTKLVPDSEKKNIFGQTMAAISKAKKSVFIDLFFIGGSMGVAMAKKLIEMTINNPELKVYVLTDMTNLMGYSDELQTTYNYLRAYSEKYPDSGLIVLEANVKLKPTAAPPFMDLLVDDQTLTSILNQESLKGYQKKIGGYPKLKSDHSKVIVVDGTEPEGVAIVGSKNYTDTSGGIAYDEATFIQGPAVPMILDSYYYDLKNAALQDMYPENKQGNNSSMIQSKVSKQFKSALEGSSFDSYAKALLSTLDVMGRYKSDDYLNQFSMSVESKGETTLQLGQNDVYGIIRSPLEQNIHLILSAREQILISDQFLYEPRIVDALRYAVTARPGLKIKIILASLSSFIENTDGFKPKEFAHLPNNLFIDDLTLTFNSTPAPIEAKWKTIPLESQNVLKAILGFGSNLAPEFHLKAISIDGLNEQDADRLCSLMPEGHDLPQDDGNVAAAMGSITWPSVLVSGSANKDNMTMSGGFREFQVNIYDKISTIRHDCLFWQRWNDPSETRIADPYDFKVPADFEKKEITPQKFVAMIKAAFLTAYNFTSVIFE